MSAVLAPCLALVSSLAPSPSAADEATDEGVGARSISRPVPPGNTFPVPAPHDVSFSDSWHACRDGCRRQHKGNDLMAAEGTPVVAVESGVIARVDNRDDGNGGLSVWLLGDSGVAYYYAHNSANLVVPGQPVARGQVIARVGHTGNARTTPPHIHFQVNTCGELSSAEPCTVDPHDDLRAWPQELIDGGADAVGVYMPTDATFRLRTDGGSPLPPAAFGSVADGSRPVAGDWDGDGRDTVGVFRPHDATFLLRDDAGAPLAPVPAGQPGDLPAVGDWDGDGRDTVGYYRPATATFRLHDESGRALPPVTFGTPVAGTAPVAASNPAVGPEGATTPDAPPAADGPGVGANLAAVARAAGPPIPPASTFTPHAPVVDAAPAAPGAPQVVPVAGDWDGDRRDTVALFRPVDATFVVRDRSGAARPPVLYGRPGDLPLVGDWDGDGRDTFGVYRPHDASYHLQGFTDRPGQATEAGEEEAAAVPAAVPEPQGPLGPLVFGPAMSPGAQPVAGDWNGHDLVTADDLHAIFGADLDEVVAAENLALLNQAMVQAGAVTPGRKAALLATLHGESGLRHDAVEGGSSAWRGRGFIQLTGEGNYRRAGRDLGVDLLDDAGLAVDPEISAAVASWYWTVARNLNLAADRLDMAAVNIAMGYGPSPQVDLERCADFLRALAWFTGGNVPTGVNCERTPRAFETARAAMEPPQPPAEPGPDDPAAPAPGSPDRPPPPSDTSTPAPPPTSSTTLPSPTTSPPTTGQPPTPPSTTTTTTAPPPTTTTTGPPPTAPPESTTTTTGQPTTTTTATTPPTTNPP